MLWRWCLALARAHNPHDPIADLAVGPDGRVFVTREPAANWRLTELAASDDDGWSFRRVGRGLADPAPLAGVEVVGERAFAWSERTLWRSDDGGATFRPAWAAPADERILAVAAAADAGDATVFVGTTDRLARSVRGGAFETVVDRGVAHLAAGRDLGADPTVAAAAGGLVIASADGGATFAALGRGLPTVRSLAVGAGEVWVGTDAGAHRRPTPADPLAPIAALAGERIDLLAASPAVATDGAWFLASATGGLHRVTDGGASVVPLPTGARLSSQSDDHWLALGFGPGWPAAPTLWLGAFEGLFVSFDGGATWAERDTRPPPLVNAIAASPAFADDGGVAVATYDAGVAVSLDRGDRFSPRSVGLVHPSVYGLDWAREADGSTTLLAGMLGHLSSRPAADPAARWRNDDLGPPQPYATRTVASPAFADDGTVFVGTRTHGLWRTTDRGATWTNVLAHPGPTASIAISPAFADDGTVLVSGFDGGVWRSVDGGDTFAPVPVAPGWAFVAASADPLRYAAGGAAGLSLSTDGGATFSASAALPEVPIDAVAWAGRSTLYVAARDGALHRSDDAGGSFSAVGSDLAAAGAFLVELTPSPDHDRDGTLFGSDGEALWRTTDRGARFARIDPDPVRYEETCQAVRVSGGVRTSDAAASSRGRVTLAGDDEVRFDFVGRRLRILGPTGPALGGSVARVDGATHPVGAAGAARGVATLLDLRFDDDGPHALLLEPAPGESFMLDAFEVFRRPDAEPPDHSADTGLPGAHSAPAPHGPAPGGGDAGDGCGCSASGGRGAAALALASAAARRRRRPRASLSARG